MSGRTLLLVSLAASVASLNLAPGSEVARPLCNLPRDGGRRSWLASAAAAAATTTLLPVAAHADTLTGAFGGMELSKEQDTDAAKLMKRMASNEVDYAGDKREADAAAKARRKQATEQASNEASDGFASAAGLAKAEAMRADEAAAAALAAPVDGRMISDATVGGVSRAKTKPKITTDATIRRELIGLCKDGKINAKLGGQAGCNRAAIDEQSKVRAAAAEVKADEERCKGKFLCLG